VPHLDLFLFGQVVVIILLASNKALMGTYTSSRLMIALGWATAAVMSIAAIVMVLPS
jgi:Mn2+/Fe2+ NRAMP family transporter